MNERRILSYKYLRDTLFEIIRIHDDISERTPFRSDVDVVLPADRFPDYTIEIDFPGISQLAHSLQVMTTVDVQGDLGSLAELMAEATIMANQPGRIIVERRHESGQATAHESKMRMELSIACVVAFAQFYGYDINGILHEDIYLALLLNDWERLVRIFRECLQIAAGKKDSDALLQRIERQFAGSAERQLSAQSYWNLRSVAEQERWSITDVMMLIEAHLNPLLDPSLVHRSSTVSGNDWRRLYDWIHQGDGRMLWSVMSE